MTRAYPPTLKVIDPANAAIKIEARIASWASLRVLARDSGCAWHEVRVGLITKSFAITGTQAQLQDFVNEAWYDEKFGDTFRKALEEAM